MADQPVPMYDDDTDDPADARRYLSGSCWADNCGECTDRACEHNCGHEASNVDHSRCDWGWKQVKCDRCGTEFTCTPSSDFYCTPEGDHCCEPCLLRRPKADHPRTDLGDGRTECDVCGQFVWRITHSCSGLPVTAAAEARWWSLPHREYAAELVADLDGQEVNSDAVQELLEAKGVDYDHTDVAEIEALVEEMTQP